MLRVALRPRYLGLLALMIAATLVCGLLASWQWDRAHRSMLSEAAKSALSQEDATELTDVLETGGAVTNDLDGLTVTVTGSFAADEQVLVADRSIDGRDAVIVVTALHVTLEDGTEVRLPVARGWIAREDVTGADGGIDRSLVPAAPAGEVTVVGLLEASEAASAGIEDGLAPEIATPQLVNVWGSPMYSGYVGQTSAAEGLQPMPAAESSFSRGLNLQNLGYAAQWILFGVFFLYLWYRSVRTAYLDEAAARREELEAALAVPSGDAAASDPDAPSDPADLGAAGVDFPAGAPGAGPLPGAEGAARSQEDADAGTPAAR
ncbi:SURF1 family protein [Brachybacterium sp. DNPG3]